MSNFNENTRVQVPAALHLCKLGYTYLDHIGALDTQTNIIVDVFLEAMIVCKTNQQARELYRLWQERFYRAEKVSLQHEEQLMMAAEPMIMRTEYKPLTASLILHDEGDKLERKEYIDGFKKLMNVDVLIVNKMLLTGFDAPRLKKLYLGRSLDGHDLLQALTRVNRPYKEFRYGQL